MSANKTHWSVKYIGQPYIEGLNDCASFTVKVQREIFSRNVELPQDRAPGLRGISKQIEQHKDDIAEPTDEPIEGDAVLMVGRGRLNHIGIYVFINGVAFVLHAMRDAKQVCLHRLRDLPSKGLQVEGFYKWKT